MLQYQRSMIGFGAAALTLATAWATSVGAQEQSAAREAGTSMSAASVRAYEGIDGARLHRYVEEQAAIARRYRDAGNKFWGRLIGTSGDTETAEWMAQKLREAGATNVRIEPIPVGPQWIPQEWTVEAVGGGETVLLASAWPIYGTPETPAQGLDLEMVYLGGGTAADFAGRDVQGKAAVVYSMPMSSTIRHSAALDGAFRRAAEYGAAAIFVVIEMPGNVRHLITETGVDITTFALGAADGQALRKLLESAAPGQPPRLRLSLDVDMVPGLSTANVWGEVPAAEGSEGEDVLIVAHRDAFFEGAIDNASGVATTIGLVEHFAKVPRAQRRRTLRVVGTPGHHDLEGTGSEWLLKNAETVLAKTALLINAEHTGHTLLDRWGRDLMETNVSGPYTWTVNGSPRLLEIANRSFDAFAIPRWTTPGGPTGEMGRVRNLVPSLGLMHAEFLLHTDLDTPKTIPPAGIAAATRAYAMIIDQVNQLDLKDLTVVK